MYMYMYEVDRVYGLTESGKNLSLSLARAGGMGGWGRKRKQLNTKKFPTKKNLKKEKKKFV